MKSVGPIADDSLSLAQMQRVDAICQRFEAAWKHGETPSLEKYLTEAEAGERLALLRELLWLELHYRTAEAKLAEYEARYPQDISVVRAVFASVAPDTVSPTRDEVGIGEAAPAEAGPDTISLSPADTLVRPDQLPDVPGYEVQSVLGHGGMGVVYKARHLALKRTVALKMVLTGGHASSAERQRFVAEAEAVAALQHPNIVQVFDVGQHDGLPYMALEYVAGGSLQASLRDRLPAAHEAAWLVEQLARGIAAAHAKGIIHRDLKPANVLLSDERGGARSNDKSIPVSPATSRLAPSPPSVVPKITDFGLAKKVEAGSGLTQTGAILGTPSYMAPEQADGRKDIGPAADVYALGAILYECLTGRPPFRGATPMDTILQVLTEEPPAVRQLQPRCPRDLETICHKCLHKDPLRRYGSAVALAEDLRRFRADEPILARPITRLERGWRLCRRHPARVIAATLALVVLVVVPVVFAAFEAHNSRQLSAALKDSRRQAAASTLERALALCEEGEVPRGLLLLTRGLRTAEEAEAVDLQDAFRWNLGAWSREAHALQRIITQPADVLAAAYSPDGAIIATGAKDGKVRLWRTATGESIGPELEHPGMVHAVAFDPTGATLLTGCDDGIARQWNVTTGQCLDPVLVHFRPDKFPNPNWPFRMGVLGVAFSPDGQTIATAGFNRTAQLWDARTGKPRGAPLNHASEVNAVAFSADGASVWTGSADKHVRQWAASSGTLRMKSVRHEYVRSMALSPNGEQVVAGYHQGTAAHRIDPATGALLDPPLKHLEAVEAVACSADGKMILTGSLDQTARLWDAGTGQPLSPPLPHLAGVAVVAFHPTEMAFLTGDRAGAVRLWKVAPTHLVRILPHDNWVRGVAFSADGRTLAATCTSPTKALNFWDVETGRPTRAALPVSAPSRGQRNNWMEGLSIHPDGETVWACIRQDAVLVRYDIATGKPLATIATAQKDPFRLTATRDGRHLLSGAKFDGTARIWDTATGKPVGPPLKHEGAVGGVAFSPDGAIALTGSDDQTTRLWDAATGEPLGPPKRHGTGILAVAFSPDGRSILTGARNGAAQIWNAATWEPRGTPMQHQGAVEAVLFSPDGKMLLTGAKDGAARFWHTASSKPIGPPLRHRAVISALAWSPDGRIVATGSDDMYLKLWAAPTLPTQNVEQLARRIEVVSGMAIDANGTFRVLEPAAWQERRDAPDYQADESAPTTWQVPASLAKLVPQLVDDKIHDVGSGLQLSGELGIAKALAYRVRLAAGKRYVFEMTGPNSHVLIPSLQLLDANGKKLAEDVNNGKAKNARIRHTAINTAVCQIVASDFQQNGTGSFAVTIRADHSKAPWHNEELWVIQGQELLQKGVDKGSGFCFGDPTWTDYDFEVEAETLGGTGEFDVAFRVTDHKKCMYAALGGFNNVAHAVFSAGLPSLSSIAFVRGKTVSRRWYRVRVEARGNQFKLYLDARLLVAFDSDKHPRGAVGVWATGTSARFRNPKVTAPDGRVLLQTWDDEATALGPTRKP